jgi:hypothetical protein
MTKNDRVIVCFSQAGSIAWSLNPIEALNTASATAAAGLAALARHFCGHFSCDSAGVTSAAAAAVRICLCLVAASH